MALDTSTNVVAKTILASEHDDRMAEPPVATVVFKRVEPTGQNGVWGLPTYKDHSEPWRYTIRVTAVAVITDLQKFAMRLLVKHGANHILASRGLAPATGSEINAARDALFAAGQTFDWARTQAWEDFETRRRAGEVFACQFEVTEGKQRMVDAGIPTS